MDKLFNWLGEKLGINELRKRLDNLENRVSALESSTELILKDFGNYKRRTQEELKLMESQVSRLLDQIDDVLSTLDDLEGITRAKSLQRRLRHNHTRIKNVMVA
jgi:molecular chaperone GrpE (heat shock protein)